MVALCLAHGLNTNRKCVVVTDDVAFARVGERINERVYRCDNVYAAIVPELFGCDNKEEVSNMLKLGVVAIEEATGERAEDVIICWNGVVDVDFEIKAEVQLYRSGLVTTDTAEYNWRKDDTHDGEGGALRYMVFYDKKQMKSVEYETIEKVFALDAEHAAIRRMEQNNRFKLVAGGYFNIANDIAVKRCGMFESVMKELRDLKK